MRYLYCKQLRPLLPPVAGVLSACMEFQQRVALAPYTTFGIGGPAQWFAEAQTEQDIEAAVAFAQVHNLRLFVLGGGSNLLVSDEGYAGLVLRIAIPGVAEERGEAGKQIFRVGAGEDWDGFVAFTVNRGCGGLACLSGIPGTVGGTPVQNVGAYGQEVAETITSVRAFDLHHHAWVELSNAECGFSYRRSIFNSTERGRYIVARVDFAIEPGSVARVEYPDLKRYFQDAPAPSPQAIREAVRSIRHQKGMLLVPGETDCRSAGSFFKNPVVPAAQLPELARALAIAEERIPRYPAGEDRVKIPAAWLLDQAGFAKGYCMGPAGISTRHTLALTNRGEAQAVHILALRDRIQQGVREKFGIALEPEPVWVS